MIVWGGYYYGRNPTSELNTGGRYDPSGDTWVPTSTGPNVPSRRLGHTAVWSGSQMIVWGGEGLNDGGRYCICPNGTLSYRDEDGDGDGIGDACDVGLCGGEQQVVDASISIARDLGRRSGTLSWRTNAEDNIVGFNILVVDPQGVRTTRLNPAPMACKECVTGL